MLSKVCVNSVRKFSKAVSSPAKRIGSRLARTPMYSFSQVQDFSKPKVEPLTINKYMRDVYLTSLMTFGSAILGGYMLAGTALGATGGSLMLGSLTSLAGVVGFSFSKPQMRLETDINGNEKVIAVNTFTRKLWYGTFLAGSAIAFAPIFKMVSAVNPATIPMCALITLGTFLGSSAYAIKSPLGKFNSWGSVLTGSLVTLIAMQLVGWGSMALMGANAFSKALFAVQPYFVLGLFTAFQVYDTHTALAAYENGQIDTLGHSLNFVLNMKNIFISLLQIFGMNSD